MPLLSQFESWATANGITTSLVPKTSEGMGVGLFVDMAADQSNQETASGDLLFVPHSLILSRSNILSQPCPDLAFTIGAIGEHAITERLALLLFLLYERLILKIEGSTPSKVTPYIAVLPEISTPVTLDPELVQGYLAGTILLDSVCAKRKKLEAEYAQLSGNRGAFEHWPVKPTVTDFIWADATVWSRVLSFQSQVKQNENELELGDDLHMVPYLDFANHANQSNIRWQVDEQGLRVWGNEHLTLPEDAKEPEVFLSYGEKPNAELLFLYGFTLKDNPTKFLTFPLPMDEEDPYYMPKAHTLMRQGIPPRVTLYVECGTMTDMFELCSGLWINKKSLYLLWIYALNEEDGLSALIEEPESKVCVPHKDLAENDDEPEEVDLVDEEDVGRLIMTIQGTQILSNEQLEAVVPKLEIYPILMLRALVTVAARVEHYVARIMETGDKVQKTEHVEIVRAVRCELDDVEPIRSSPALSQLEEDKEEVLRLGPHVANLVVILKNYRVEEMEYLVQVGDLLGEGQTKMLEENDFVQEYLAKMQH
ncbi:hypothetical protein BGZ59_008428 [Podila verticillata]|nr:hypothetical protein BGZ59_008428 [Podila verticillata]KAI9238712.1 MAG: hypothetical protein BYD32DRAFT_460418 [Podila humilis]KFH68428.1 hypothetical protein MVEG_05243 [Podila verticillata NRRL 6337]